MKSGVFAVLCLMLPGFTATLSAFDREEGAALVAHIVQRQPADREIMFIEMLFSGPNRNMLFHDQDLEGLVNMVRKTRNKRFARDYEADVKYRAWLLDNLDEVRAYNQSKWDDLNAVAVKMSDASLEMNDRLNNLNKRNLLYLIQFAAGLPSSQVLTDKPFRISVGQLLPVLRAEYNTRK